MARQISTVSRLTRIAGTAALGAVVALASLQAPKPAAAATISSILSFPDPICDMSTSPRGLYVSAPRVLAPNDTAGVDSYTVRYWVRLYNANTLQVLTDWTLGGTAKATDTTPAPFASQGRTYNQAYALKYNLSTTVKVRVQYFVRWSRADGSTRAESAPGAFNYQVAQLVYMYGIGYVPMLSSTATTC